MRTLTQPLAAGLLLALAAHAASPTGASSTPGTLPMQSAKQFQFQQTTSAQVDYLLFLPRDYAPNAEKRWPLLFFLHGAGERGTDLNKVAVHGPPKIVAQQPDFPFIVLSPQCPEGKVWSNDLLLALLDDVLQHYAVDRARVYLTGLSMGGYGTWSLGVAHPERFAAIVPICGGGEILPILLASGERAAALKSLGVWAFHGAKDPVVPLEESQRMVNGLKKIGVQEVKLTVYPEAGHDAWTETYKNPELYDWLLQHQRKPAANRP